MALPTKPGDLIGGKYRIERVLGTGGMGVVVEAHHLTLDDRVAIKFLNEEALANTSAVGRFVREAQAAARIKSEHVCRVHDVVMDGEAPYMVMELLAGKDLEALAQESGPLAPSVASAYLLQACEALAEAHLAGIIHRDLKPANLFLAARPDGSPLIKVLDFGISKLAPRAGANAANVETTSSLIGTPLYMSPEQMRVRPDIDARTDIWSLGVILYELTVGEPPFTGATIPLVCANILGEPPAPAGARIPQAFEAVIVRCLAKDPADRYGDVAELAEALRPFASETSAISLERIRRLADRGAKGVSSPDVTDDSDALPRRPRGSPEPVERASGLPFAITHHVAPLGEHDAAAPAQTAPRPRSSRTALLAGVALAGLVAVGVVIAASASRPGSGSRLRGDPGAAAPASSAPPSAAATWTASAAVADTLAIGTAGAPSSAPTSSSVTRLSPLPPVASAEARPPSPPAHTAAPRPRAPARPPTSEFGGRY